MTCPNCARRVKAALLLAVLEGRISPDTFVEASAHITTTKEPAMHAHLTIVNGDIGIEEEEWEVVEFPTETPAETPAEAPAEPVPA